MGFRSATGRVKEKGRYRGEKKDVLYEMWKKTSTKREFLPVLWKSGAEKRTGTAGKGAKR